MPRLMLAALVFCAAQCVSGVSIRASIDARTNTARVGAVANDSVVAAGLGAKTVSDETMEPVSKEDENGTKSENGTEEGHHSKRYQMAGFDFAYVADPFVISGWILLASLAKIGTVRTTH